MSINNLQLEMIKLQFSQIIDAIKSTRERIHQFSISLIIGIPAVLFLSKGVGSGSLESIVNTVAFISPILILAFYFFYISELAAIRLYGAYIEKVLDPIMEFQIKNEDSRICFTGWHTYMNVKNKKEENYNDTDKDYIVNYKSYKLKEFGMALLIISYMLAAIWGSSRTIVLFFSDGQDKNTANSSAVMFNFVIEIAIIIILYYSKYYFISKNLLLTKTNIREEYHN